MPRYSSVSIPAALVSGSRSRFEPLRGGAPRRLASFFILCALLKLAAAEAGAATIAYDGGASGTGSALDTAANWEGDVLPGTNDEAVLDTSIVALLPSPLTLGSDQAYGDLVWNSGTSGAISVASGSTSYTLTLSGDGTGAAAVEVGGNASDLIVMGAAANGALTIGGNAAGGSGRVNLALAKAGNFDVVNAGATLNVVSSISGGFALTKTGAGTAVFSGANTYTGATTVSAGTLTLNGTAGTLATPSITVAGGTFNEDNSGVNYRNSSRFTAGAPALILQSGTYALTGSSTASNNTVETLGALTLDSGANTILLTQGTATNTSTLLTASSLVRNNNATARVSGATLGQGSTSNNIALLRLTAAPTGAAGTLIGGAGTFAAGNAKNIPIVPFLVGDLSATALGATFVGYDSTNNTLRALKSGELNTFTATTTTAAVLTGATATDNVRVTSSATAFGITGSTVNSAIIDQSNPGGTPTITLTGTLTPNSGALLFSKSSGVGFNTTLSGTGNLTFATTDTATTRKEGIITNTVGARVTIATPIIGSAGMTFSNYGAGSAIYLNATENYPGITTVNGGILNLGTNSAGSLGTNTAGIMLNGGATLQFSRTDTALALSNAISGDGGVTQAGTGTTTLSGANTYTGATAINAGTLTLQGTAGTLATPSITVLSGTFNEDNSGANYRAAARFTNATAPSLTLRAGTYKLTGSGATGNNTVETVGALTLDAGANTITITQGSAPNTSTVLTAASLVRNNSATGRVTGSSLGQMFVGTNLAFLRLAAAPSAEAGTLIGGTGSYSTGTDKTIPIVPFLIGDSNATGTGTTFVGYDSTNLTVRALAASEFNTFTSTPANLATAGATENVRVSSSAAAVAVTGSTVNSINFEEANAGAAVTYTLSGTLSPSSGAVLFSNSSGSTARTATLTGGSLAFAAGDSTTSRKEGIITNALGAALTINTPISGTGGVTFSNYNSGSTITIGGTQSYTGKTTVNGGTFIIGTGTAGDLGGNTSEILLNVGSTLRFNRTNAGLLLPNAITGVGAVTQAGSGTTTLSGASSYTGATQATGGTLNLAGSNLSSGSIALSNAVVNISGTYTLNAGLTVAATGSTVGVLNILSGANLTIAGGNSFTPGAGATSTGAVNQSDGTVVSTGQMIFGGGGTSAFGSYNMSGGSLTVVDRFRVGGGGNTLNGIFYQSGGDVTLQFPNGFEVGGNGTGGFSNATGVSYITGGTLTALVHRIGYNSSLSSLGGIRGEQTIDGTASITVNGITTLGQGAGDVGILNLNGGTYAPKQIVKGNGTAFVNFDGGTLKPAASATSASFFTGVTGATVYAGGLTVDTSGQALTIGQALLAPAGTGVKTISVANGGSGYISAPIITIAGAGTGATAVAIMADDGSGNGTLKIASILVSSPGTNYTDTPTITTTGGRGSGGSAATFGTVTTGTSVSGGLTKTGTGTLTLSGANTYTGPTIVSGGTLEITGSLSATELVSVTGSTLQLRASNAVNNSAAISLGTGGRLGTGGFSEFIGTGTGTGVDGTGAGLGSFTLGGNSTIDFGSSSSSILWFGSSAFSAGTLTIENWSGNPLGGGTDQLRFTDNPSDAFVNQILFAGIGGATEIFFANPDGQSYYEIVPVPEPSSVALLGGLGLFGLIGSRRRNRRAVQMRA